MSNQIEIPLSRDLLTPQYKGYIAFDIDGVIGRWVNTHLPNHSDLIKFQEFIQQIKEAGVGIGIITNRPAGHLPLLAYNLGIKQGYWVGESGAVIYDVLHHQAIVTKPFLPLIPEVAKLRESLIDQQLVAEFPTSFSQAQFEPGGALIKTVIIPPIDISKEDFANHLVIPYLQSQNLIGPDGLFEVTIGKAIDIDPKGLSKEKGMETLLSTNQVNPSLVPSLLIADANRDIPAATYLANQGGVVAAVGNASSDYQTTVESLGGIVAPEFTSYHSSVNYILDQFIKQYNLL